MRSRWTGVLWKKCNISKVREKISSIFLSKNNSRVESLLFIALSILLIENSQKKANLPASSSNWIRFSLKCVSVRYWLITGIESVSKANQTVLCEQGLKQLLHIIVKMLDFFLIQKCSLFLLFVKHFLVCCLWIITSREIPDLTNHV